MSGSDKVERVMLEFAETATGLVGDFMRGVTAMIRRRSLTDQFRKVAVRSSAPAKNIRPAPKKNSSHFDFRQF